MMNKKKISKFSAKCVYSLYNHIKSFEFCSSFIHIQQKNNKQLESFSQESMGPGTKIKGHTHTKTIRHLC